MRATCPNKEGVFREEGRAREASGWAGATSQETSIACGIADDRNHAHAVHQHAHAARQHIHAHAAWTGIRANWEGGMLLGGGHALGAFVPIGMGGMLLGGAAAHVALDGGRRLVHAALEERAHDRERRALDVLHEDDTRELVHGLGHLFGLEDTLDDLGDRVLDVLVLARGRARLHSRSGLLLHLRLNVPHQRREHWDDVVNAPPSLCGERLGDHADQLRAPKIRLPLVLVLGEEHGHDALHAVLRQLGDERLSKLVGLERDGLQLVGKSLESVGEERHEHRLGRVPKLGVQGAEEAEGSRAPIGRLLRLVRDHRLERGQSCVDLDEVSLGELVHDGLALSRAVLWRGSRQELGGVDGRHGAYCLVATLRAQADVQAPVSQIVRLVLVLLLLLLLLRARACKLHAACT